MRYKVSGNAHVECTLDAPDESEALEKAYELFYAGWNGDFSSLLRWTVIKAEEKDATGITPKTTRQRIPN